MKKSIPIVLSSILTSSLLIPFTANAEEKENNTTINQNINPSEEVAVFEEDFSYNYKGIDVTSDVELNESELADLYKNSRTESQGITTFQNDIGSNAITVVPAKKTNYTNSDVKFAADVITAWLGTKIPVKLTKKTYRNYLVTKLTGFSSYVKPTYVETYVTRAWSEYDKMYIFKSTVVHYTDSTYKKIKSINYREINRSKTKVLSGVNGYAK